MSDIYQQFLKQRKEPITEESYPAWLQNKVEDLQADNERLRNDYVALCDFLIEHKIFMPKSVEDRYTDIKLKDKHD